MEAKSTANAKAAEGRTPSRLAATLAFDAGVERVRAVSGERRAALEKMGIRTVRDLLGNYPRRYVDMSEVCTIASAPIGGSCTISGRVHEVRLKRPKPRLDLVEITLVDGTGTMIVTCFKQPWLADKLHQGDDVAVSGKVEFNYGFKRMTNPFLEQPDSQAGASGMVVPVHPATERIPTAWMRRIIGNALSLCRGIEDPLPLDLRCRYRLPSRQSALSAIHFPSNMADAAQARRRLAYEELLFLQLHLMESEYREDALGSYRVHSIDGPCVMALEKAVPFELTDEQRLAVEQILQVLSAPRRANHMLLGDVGTGKTIVSAFALAAAADSGSQAMMMAPTEVLAEQHMKGTGPLLEGIGIRCALLTGSTPPSEREAVLASFSKGGIQVLFGTQALLEPDVVPADCSLVVIDEQQRFGVRQRQTLVGKGADADVLSLTATPIPRSLALALYGNMTLSYIRQRPMNRAGVTTRVLSLSDRLDAYDAALGQLRLGHQVYVVCPLVGQSRGEDTKKKGDGRQRLDDYAYSSIAIESEADLDGGGAREALKHAEYLRGTVFPGFTVGVLHGKMPAEEKRRVMEDFRKGETGVLVSTTVIEVGVDVPNATVIIVEDADRFGLAQLHQLRGRVGRGELAGQMFLVSGSKAPTAIERLSAMESTSDGFELAEYDLSLRREGDILGNRQHGASVLKLVNVVRDSAVVEAAHEDARAILSRDPGLDLPEHRALRFELCRLFPESREGREC